jgi:hypothetical protein
MIAEIVEKIEIDREYTISHPDYFPLELPGELADKFDRLPLPLRTRYLTSQLGNYLYYLFFTRELRSCAELEILAQQPPQIENNSIDGIDIEFGYSLHESNLGTGYLDPDWQVVEIAQDGAIGVVKDELQIYLDRECDLPPAQQSAVIGDLVSIYLPKNLVGKDAYIAVGNAGVPDRSSAIEFYFNLTPAGAIALLKEFTTALNQPAIPFTLSILHHPDLFYRADVATLLISAQDEDLVAAKAIEFCQQHRAQCSTMFPIFTQQLTTGLAMAQICPDSADGFGRHRCGLVAGGIVASHFANRLSAAARMSAIEREFTNVGLNIAFPHLNPAG